MLIALILCLSALLVSVVYAGVTSNERMSDTHYGPPVTQFPSGTAVVYVVFDYIDMQDEEITIKVWSPIGELLFEQTRAYSGSDTESIEVLGPEGGVFPDGRYATNFYTGIFPYQTLIWDVGEVTTPTPTATGTATPTATPGPVVDVSPTEGDAGQEFTFTGSDFTPHGLVHEGFNDPYQGYHYRGSFYTDSSGGFVRTIATERDWLGGVYAYIAYDSIKDYSATVEFTVFGPTATPTATATATPTASPSYELYLPIMVKDH
jgi:hypothetical protein